MSHSTINSDLGSLIEIQKAFAILQPIMDKKDDLSNTLSDVWNALLSSRECLINKILDTQIMSLVSFESDLRRILQQREN